jgi:hypothetical protein
MAYEELDQPYETGTPDVIFNNYKMFGLKNQEDIFCEFYMVGTNGMPESSWKAHISVNPAQLPTAWNLMYPVLIDNEVRHFKVARQTAQMNKANRLDAGINVSGQERQLGLKDIERLALGMQVTVYIPEGQDLRIQEVLAEIEKKLKMGRIKPGEIDKSDRALGDYCSVRNDGSGVNYRSHDLGGGYNPTNEVDPFKKRI